MDTITVIWTSRTIPCGRCDKHLIADSIAVRRVWRTGTMPGPAFYYYHPTCAREAGLVVPDTEPISRAARTHCMMSTRVLETTAQRFRAWCVDHKRAQQDVVNELLVAFLESRAGTTNGTA